MVLESHPCKLLYNVSESDSSDGWLVSPASVEVPSKSSKEGCSDGLGPDSGEGTVEVSTRSTVNFTG